MYSGANRSLWRSNRAVRRPRRLDHIRQRGEAWQLTIRSSRPSPAGSAAELNRWAAKVSMNLLSEVVQQIVAVDKSGSTTLVAVDGQGGAGKTALASDLACALEAIGRRVEIVHFDDFFLPSALRPAGEGAEKPIGGDFDWPVMDQRYGRGWPP